jgi:hypothetical protein
MGTFLVVVIMPILQFFLCVCKAQKPVSIQTFCSEATIEGFDEGIVGRLSWSGEVERDSPLISPQVQIVGDELGALIDTDRCRESRFSPDPFEHLHDAGAAECEARLERRREPRISPQQLATVRKTACSSADQPA